ncbi:protein of unknown function [Clostridium beijerinckii]|nr:protein of unknown function [Clostridium beijerinckii]
MFNYIPLIVNIQMFNVSTYKFRILLWKTGYKAKNILKIRVLET